MNWQRALDTQMDTLKWHDSDFGRKYTRSFFDIMLENAGADAYMRIHDSEILERNVRIGLARADTMFVTEDMQHLLLQAAHDLPEDMLYDPHILLTPIGFAQFDRPIYGEDKFGEKLGVSAMLWHQSPLLTEADGTPVQATLLFFFTDSNDPEDEINPKILPLLRDHGIPIPPLCLVHFYPVLEGEELLVHSEQPGTELVSALVHYFAAMQIIAHQTIGEPMKMRAPRASRKRYARFFENAPERMITLITLRRKSVKKENGDQEPVPWTRRWIVRGHWRKQWYPSEKRHGWKYIFEHIKGPEDKPLIITERRVFNFRR